MVITWHTARVLFVEVWSHLSTSPPTALAESTREDAVPACCSCVQVSAWDSTVVSRRWAQVHGRFQGLKNTFDLLPRCRWMSVIHGCPPSAIRPSLLLLSVLGTVCPNMLRPHPLCLVFEVASRLSCSGVPSHDFTATFPLFGHLNHSFYLLTVWSINSEAFICL